MLSEERFVDYYNNIAESAQQLLTEQKNDWEMCRNGYDSLSTVEVKRFDFDGFYVNVQFNPGRITSSSAKVDPKSIKERKCFLCLQNLPDEQRGILYNEKYVILCNPFPIFPEHFTIPSIEHKPQLILPSFKDYLQVTKDLSDRYIVFYNGPRCGASAPDHFHFQAGNKNFLPIISEINDIKKIFAIELLSTGDSSVYHIHDGLRKMILIEGENLFQIKKYFTILFSELEKLSLPGEEPMMNIVSDYNRGIWSIIIILREKHRPDRFFEKGEKNILLSPASVDLGGVCITPLQKDFDKITKQDVIEIFNEVILNEDKFSILVKNLEISLR